MLKASAAIRRSSLAFRRANHKGPIRSMCGIIGIVGAAPVTDRLIESLKRLEYRGYDSAGVAGVVNGHVERRRAPGKLRNLEAVLAADPLVATVGVGHTR